MAGVDSLLRILEQHGADELRLGTDQPPRILARGAPIRLSIPPTPDEMLRHLVGPLLDGGGETRLRDKGRLEVPYTPDAGGASFAVTFERRGAGEPLAFDVTLRKGAAAPVAGAAVAGRPVAGAPVGGAAVSGTPVSGAAVSGTPVTGAPVAARSIGGLPFAPPAPAAVAPSPPAAPAFAAPGAPLPSEIAGILAEAIALGASDVHLLSGDAPTLRVDGRLRAMSTRPTVSLDALLGWLGAGAQAALDRGRSVDAGLALDGAGRFRLNLYRTDGRLAAAIRVLSRAAPTLGELNFPVPLGDLVGAPHGLVLVCGPTGSGKSATLAALATEVVRRRACLLLTLEDPVEYSIGGDGAGLVRQRQIGSDVSDFPTGLRDALREDPDVLLIGEMRDPETITLALTAAETGHLVLASLHSRTTTSSIERIVDAYPPERQHQIRVQLADTLRAVVAQRLVPRARGAGRVPAVEILRGNHSVASLIREGKTAQLTSVLQSSRKEGMLTLERCLADLVRAGTISREDAIPVASDPASLSSYLQS